MKLYKEASLMMLPTSVKDGKLYSIFPQDGDGDFTFSRGADRATRVNEQGLVQPVEIVGSELVQNGDFSNGSQNWTFSGGAELTEQGARINNTVTGANANILQSNSNFTQGKLILFEYDVVATNGKRCVIEQIGDDIELDTLTTGTDKKVYFVFDRADTNLLIKRAATGTDVTLDNISVVEVTEATDLPRLDWSGECPVLLLEPQRTNKIEQSENFSDATVWNTNSGSVSLESGYLAPDGTNTAYKITQGSTKTSAILFSGTGGILGTDARSIFAKTTSGTGQIDLCSHDLNTNNNFTVTEEWQRFEVNGTTSGAGATNFYAVDFRGSSTDLTEVIIWGAQSEVGSYVTSYIPTRGQSATRAADDCSVIGISDLIGQTEGTLFVEANLSDVDSSTQRGIAELNDGGTLNRITLFRNYNGTIRLYVRNGGTAQMDATYSTPPNGATKIAIAYTSNDIVFYVNGSLVASDSSATIPACSDLDVGQMEGNLTKALGDSIKQVLLFKTRLSDNECINLTTI